MDVGQSASESNPMEKGVQPLDNFMLTHNLSNHDLVAVSKESLTHKMVSRGRKGRRLTLNVQYKILNALNEVVKDSDVKMTDLFNYPGKR